MYGAASQAMDSLTFATPKLIRNLTTPAFQKAPIDEYDYGSWALHAFHRNLRALPLWLLDRSSNCICSCHSAGAGGPEADARPVCGPVHPVRLRLPGHHLGCAPRGACQSSRARQSARADAEAWVPGIGHVQALALIQKHTTLEGVLASLDPGEHAVPSPFPFFWAGVPHHSALHGRRLHSLTGQALCSSTIQLVWQVCVAVLVVKCGLWRLVQEKGFSERSVRKEVRKVSAARSGRTQGGIDPLPVTPSG